MLRATEWTESLRDMVTTIFETNLSLQDARLNTVMKKLTGWAAIIAVPTAVTGWFGQNVPYPGFGKPSGCWLSTVVIAGARRRALRGLPPQLDLTAAPAQKASVAGQLAVGHAVRPGGVGAEALDLVGLVGLELPSNQYHFAGSRLTLVGENVRRHPVEEPPVVADDDGAARELEQRVLERAEGLDVEVDLDVETLGSLENALLDFPGCAVVITHDRWFLDRVATHILAYEGTEENPANWYWFEGNFESYEANKVERLGPDAARPHRVTYLELYLRRPPLLPRGLRSDPALAAEDDIEHAAEAGDDERAHEYPRRLAEARIRHVLAEPARHGPSARR